MAVICYRHRRLSKNVMTASTGKKLSQKCTNNDCYPQALAVRMRSNFHQNYFDKNTRMPIVFLNCSVVDHIK